MTHPLLHNVLTVGVRDRGDRPPVRTAAQR